MYKVVSLQVINQILYSENAIRSCLAHYCPEHDTITDPMSLSDGSYGLLLRQLKVDHERDPSINYRIIPVHFSAIAGVDGHWISIQLILKDKSIDITVIDPLGFNNEVTRDIVLKTEDVFTGYTLSVNVSKEQRQQDVISCGAIVVDDIRQLVKKEPLNVYEKGAIALRQQHLEDVSGLRDLLMKDLERVNSSAIVLPKAPELTTELERILHHVHKLVSNNYDSFDALVQSKGASELKQIIFLLDDLEPLRTLLFNLHADAWGEIEDHTFKDDAMTNLSLALSLFREGNERSPLYVLKESARELKELDIENKSNRLKRCLVKFTDKSEVELLESLKELTGLYLARLKLYPEYKTEYRIVSSLSYLCKFSMALAMQEIHYLSEKVSAVKMEQAKSIDELWQIILAENETIVPYVHCLNQLEMITPIEGVNIEEALFVFLNISSEIVKYNHLIKKREYQQEAIEEAYSKIPQTDRDRYQKDSEDCWTSFSVWIELFRDPLKAFSMIECYGLDSYDQVEKEGNWISLEDKTIIEEHLFDLNPEQSAVFVLNYIGNHFGEEHNALREKVSQTVSAYIQELTKAEIYDDPEENTEDLEGLYEEKHRPIVVQHEDEKNY